MVSVRSDNSNGLKRRPSSDPKNGRKADCRLNLLLSYGGWQSESWADQLPRLLSPMGVEAWRVETGAEATDLIRSGPRMHLAVVDLTLPLEAAQGPLDASARPAEGGTRLLHLLERLPDTPPTIVIKRATGARDDARMLTEALRRGVFAVVDRPVEMELMLEVFRRVLRRHYRDRWPAGPEGEGDGEPPGQTD